MLPSYESVRDLFSVLSLGPPFCYVIPSFDVLLVELRKGRDRWGSLMIPYNPYLKFADTKGNRQKPFTTQETLTSKSIQKNEEKEC